MLHVTRAPDGTERVLLDPAALDPTGTDHARRLGARPGGPPAGLPALLRRRRAVGAARARRRHRRGRRAADRPLPLLRRRLAARRRGVPLRPDGRRGRGAAGRAGLPPPDLAAPDRHPDRRRRAGRRPRPLRASTPTTASTSPATAAGCWSPATSAPPAATACGSPTWRRRRPPWSRCSPRPTTCSATPGWTATAGSTCTPPTARRAGGSPSPTRATPGPRALARAGRRGPRLGADRRRAGWSPPARTTRPTACSCSPAAGTRSPRWRCTRRDGTPRGTVPLPGTGSLTGLTVADRRHPGAGRAGCGSAGPTSSPRRRCTGSTWRAATTVLETAAPGAVDVPRGAHRAARRSPRPTAPPCACSSIAPARTGRARARRCVTGYGGFGISPDPAYSSVRAGLGRRPAACYALVSLRGGGEEGEDWHLRRQPRQQAERVRRLPRRRRRR